MSIPASSTDPGQVTLVIDGAVAQAIQRSGDYQTAFLPTPNEDLLFLNPATSDEITCCKVGEVWSKLVDAIDSAEWSAITYNLIGFLYEAIIDAEYRHALGQHYTQEDVVDILTTFAVQSNKSAKVLDPAAGGGSFLRSAYALKRNLGCNHSEALGDVWGCELSSFAAELSTVTLATADPAAAAGYPRVLISDFFDLRPGGQTQLVVPDHESGPLELPAHFDAVIGNPPYISYRHQFNQAKVLKALSELPQDLVLPRLSGKSDEYAWFLVHATQFLKSGGRLGFVVSSAILVADYGIPLIRFLAQYYVIQAVVDSMVERWFDADTNTVLLFLERQEDPEIRMNSEIRFVRLRRPLAQLLAPPLTGDRQDSVNQLLELILSDGDGDEDPRLTVVKVRQGPHGGLTFDEVDDDPSPSLLSDGDSAEDDEES